MRKIYKKLTADQKARGVIFSSTLSASTTELAGDTIHEVTDDMPDKYERISNLKDDSFFRDTVFCGQLIRCPYRYHIIRQ